MKISRVEVDLSELEPSCIIKEEPEKSSTETATFDEMSRLQSTWQLTVESRGIAGWDFPDDDSYDRGDEKDFSLNIRLLNYKDFRNENVMAFGTAYLNSAYEDEHSLKRMDLPVRHLQKLTSDIVWCFQEDLDVEEATYIFHASISLVYNEPPKIQNDFSDLLEGGKYSDVVLLADQEYFKVHKNILSARSVVFRRMFENDMKEKQEGKVEIEDVRREVLQEMLRFMYTGKVAPSLEDADVDEGMLKDLYVAADRYDVQDLKEILSVILQEGTNSENGEHRLALAEQFGDDGLIKKCFKILYDDPPSPEAYLSDSDWGDRGPPY